MVMVGLNPMVYKLNHSIKIHQIAIVIALIRNSISLINYEMWKEDSLEGD